MTQRDTTLDPESLLVESEEEHEAVSSALEVGPSSRRLGEVKGVDAVDFMENSGFQRERVVPDAWRPWMEFHTFETVSGIEQLNWLVDQCIAAGHCSLDLETEGLDNRIQYREDGTPETVHKIVGYCISFDEHTGWYVPVRHCLSDEGQDLNIYPTAAVDAAITRLCRAAIPAGTKEAIEADPLSWDAERPALVIYFWNAAFDHEFLYPVTGIDWWHPLSFEDGMLACFCINAGDKKLSLKLKSKELLRDPKGRPYEMVELKELFFGRRKDIRFATLAPDEPGVKRYTGSDAVCTFKLCTIPNVVPLVLEKYGYTYRMEKQVSNVVRVMERSRIKINREHVRGLLVEAEKRRDDLLKKIQGYAEKLRVQLDPNSPKQLSEFLFGPKPNGLDITPKPDKLEKSGQYKTDGDTLEELAKSPHAPGILKDIVKYREAEKFIGTYLVGLSNNPDQNDEIRVSFKQTGAASGRFSAPAGDPLQGYSGIPCHGIPGDSELRRDFEARDGYTMVKADYAGEELRIAANVTREPVWIKEFMTGTGDLHSITARAFFGRQDITKEERGMGKTANFSLIFGGGQQAVMRATGCSAHEGKRRKDAFDKAVPTFAGWCKGQHAKVKKQLGVWTPFGRWLAIPDAASIDRKVAAACERHSVNYVIQGAGADIMKISLIMLCKAFHRNGWLKNGGDDSVRMLLTVHDEVVFEIRHDRVAEAIPVIVDIMEYPARMPQKPKWIVPLVVEPLVGLNWKSGFSAERSNGRKVPEGEVDRVEEGVPLRKFEVLRNGFVYSTTREPKLDKKTREIVEFPDRQEVLEGKLFRIIDPPWLAGAALPPPPSCPPEPSGPGGDGGSPAPTESHEAVSDSTGESSPELMAVETEEEPEEVSLTLIFWDHRTAAQIGALVDRTANPRGAYLRLWDPTGSGDALPRWVHRVNKDELIDLLVERNLVHDPKNDNATAA